ncbi:MAG: histidine kinase [Hoeflea sp. BRH_c9]|nr:MAG: histidine kinase [Hoeflea sp. BRH_c9]
MRILQPTETSHQETVEIVNKDQQDAEADVEGFRENLGPFVTAAETTRIAMVFTDAKASGNPIIFANDSFLRLIGNSREDVLGQGLNSLMERGGGPESVDQITSAFAGDNDSEEIHYRRKDGSDFWATIFVSPVTDGDGNIQQYFASFLDVTAYKREQAQSRMLISELNHRVKNTLATVKSIAAQAFKSSPDMETAREAIESRLFALSRSHDLLSRENWDSAGLLDVVRTSLEPFGIADGRAERFTINGSNIRVRPNAALAFGIAFHELATNAVKYGAFSNDAGTVLIAWTIDTSSKGDRLVLRWQEKDGPPVTPPTRKGFGSRVIERGLAHELDGVVHLDYHKSGVVCTIDIPAPGPAS